MLSEVAHNSLAAFSQSWPAFALVAGLLLVGAAAAREGAFEAAGAVVARVPGGAATLLAALLGLEAVVVALLNLDTAVVFMTPVLLHAARRRGLEEAPFAYGAVFMANSASLLLPGSNLTNLIVISQEPERGSSFAARMGPAWALAVTITIVVVALALRPRPAAGVAAGRGAGSGTLRLGPGTAGVVVAAILVLLLSRPALPVLALGIAVALVARLRPREAVAAANPALLLGLLALAVAVGAAGRALGPPGGLLDGAGRWQTAWLAAGAAIAGNNLPAAVFLSSHLPAHPRALLLGLDLGPNLAVSGSLSALLWLRIVRAQGTRASAFRYSLLGFVLAPLTLAATLLVSTP